MCVLICVQAPYWAFFTVSATTRTITNGIEMTDRPTFGPWRPGIDAAERRARCRSMRAVAGLIAGPRADPLVGLLLAAETEDTALDLAADALEDLEPLDRRCILSSYAARAAPPPCYVNPLAHRLPRFRATPMPHPWGWPLAGQQLSAMFR